MDCLSLKVSSPSSFRSGVLSPAAGGGSRLRRRQAKKATECHGRDRLPWSAKALGWTRPAPGDNEGLNFKGLDVCARPRFSEVCVLGIHLEDGLLCTVACAVQQWSPIRRASCSASVAVARRVASWFSLLFRPAVGDRPRDGDEHCSRG